MELNIKHDKERKKFFAIVDGKECTLDYREKSSNVLDYYSTFVPPELRGRQIAEEITKFALDYARDNHLKIIPSCPFVQRIIERHPEYRPIVVP